MSLWQGILLLALAAAVGLAAWADLHPPRCFGPWAIYKFKLPPDPDCHGIIVVVARSVEHAREVAAAYAASDEAKAANGGNALWSRWFHDHEPTVYPVNRPGVVTWTEFLRGC